MTNIFSNSFIKVITLAVVIFLSFGSFSSAQLLSESDEPTITTLAVQTENQMVASVSGGDTGGVIADPKVFANYLKVDSLELLFDGLLTVVIILAVPIIVFFIIFSGFMYVTARGNPAKIEQATKSLTYAIIGGILIIGAVAITEIVKNLVTAFVPTTPPTPPPTP